MQEAERRMTLEHLLLFLRALRPSVDGLHQHRLLGHCVPVESKIELLWVASFGLFDLAKRAWGIGLWPCRLHLDRIDRKP